jgi:triphosphatase
MHRSVRHFAARSASSGRIGRGRISPATYRVRWGGRRWNQGRPEIGTEVELKLGVKATDLPDLKRALVAIAPTPGGAPCRLISTYYDTPDLALWHRGLTLRVREQEGRFIQTVKRGDLTGVDVLTRGEWEDQLAENRPDPNAPESGKQLPGNVADGLRPLFATDVIRTTVEIEAASSTRIEAAIDEGEIRADSGNRTAPISEIELELKCGEVAALYDVAMRLFEAAPVHIEPRSKSERGYGLSESAEAAPPPVHAHSVALDPAMTVEAALQQIGRSCLAHLLHNEPAALARQPEGVHQMRVAVRRLRSALSALKDLLPAGERRWISGELRWLVGTLAAARNLDVFATDLLQPAKAALAHKPGMDDLAAALESARRTAYDRVEEAILSERHAAGMLRLSHWFEARGWRDEGGRPGRKLAAPIGELAPSLLDRRWRQLRRSAKGFRRQTSRRRHKLRIAAKNLRYTVELLESLFDATEVEGFVKRLKRLQDDLGYANDVRVARDIVGELSLQSAPGSAVVDAGASLLDYHEHAKARGERKLRKRLERLKQADRFWRKSEVKQPRAERAEVQSG